MEIEQFVNKEMLEIQIKNMELDSVLYVADVPNNVYHSVRGWSSSHAKKAFQSEQRLHRYLTKPNDGTKDHFVFGELVHDSVRLSAEQIDGLYCSGVELYGGGTNSTKALKVCIQEGIDDITQAGFKIDFTKYPRSQEILDEIGGRTLVSESAVSDARQLADMLRSEFTVNDVMSSGSCIFELSIWRKDPDGFFAKVSARLLPSRVKNHA